MDKPINSRISHFQQLPEFSPKSSFKSMVIFIFLRVQLYAYLDDILIVGHTQQQVQNSVCLCVQHLMQDGYTLNLKKCDVSTSQHLIHYRRLLSDRFGVSVLASKTSGSVDQCVKTFLQIGQYRSAHQWLRLLSLMATTL